MPILFHNFSTAVGCSEQIPASVFKSNTLEMEVESMDRDIQPVTPPTDVCQLTQTRSQHFSQHARSILAINLSLSLTLKVLLTFS